MRLNTALATVAVLAAALASGCYAPNISGGAQKCSPDGRCANSLKCFAGKICQDPSWTPACSPQCPDDNTKPMNKVCDTTKLVCVQCVADKDCPDGFVCAAGANVCKPGCNGMNMRCAPDSGVCDVDMGACHGCLADGQCSGKTPRCDVVSGVCFECNPMKDNCPAGQYCGGVSGAYKCAPGCKADGECSPDGGTKLCCSHACTDSGSDANNCGACGNKCPTGQSCCGGICADTQMGNTNNCGACGQVCNLQNVVGPNCKLGVCDYDHCADNFGDCDGKRSNGCETNITTDPKNCGMCTKTCPLPANAMASCSKAICGLGACIPPFDDCNQNPADGCETNLQNDIKNCGKCATQCPMQFQGDPICVIGKCDLQCRGSFRNCDGNLNNGCESDTLSDPKNCGACANNGGMICRLGLNCISGSCK
jgi:Cys-rich repeat protein